MEIKETIKIYTDGACSNNGYENSSGGWAYIIIYDSIVIQGKGSKIPATNQQMELQAAIEGLLETTKLFGENRKDYYYELYTDSAYLCNCFQKKWWTKWIENGWKNSKKEPVANKDLWLKLIPYFTKDNLEIIKIKGHSGNIYNELVDELAKEAIL